MQGQNFTDKCIYMYVPCVMKEQSHSTSFLLRKFWSEMYIKNKQSNTIGTHIYKLMEKEITCT